MRIESWFLNKNFTQNERYIIECYYDFVIERETEKAVLVKFLSDDGIVKSWIPKSCILGTENNFNKNENNYYHEKEKREEERMQKGLAYNELLVNFAKENKIKYIRIGMKTQTLMKKIKDAGLSVPAR